MDVILIDNKKYVVVITQDQYGAEIGLWLGNEQVASICIDEENSIHCQVV